MSDKLQFIVALDPKALRFWRALSHHNDKLKFIGHSEDP